MEEILIKLGTWMNIMKFFGDFFDSFIVLNSLNTRVRERLKKNINGIMNVFAKEERRCLKIKKFDQHWKDFLLKSHIYKVVQLDLEIWTKTKKYFLNFLREWDWKEWIFLKRVYLSLNLDQEKELEVLKYLSINQISIELLILKRNYSKLYVTLCNKKCWILVFSQLRSRDEWPISFRETRRKAVDLFYGVKNLEFWNIKNYMKHVDSWRDQDSNEFQRNHKILNYSRTHGMKDLMERIKNDWEINLLKEQMDVRSWGENGEIESYHTLNIKKEMNFEFKIVNFHNQYKNSNYEAIFLKDFNIKMEDTKIYYSFMGKVKWWKAENVYLNKSGIIENQQNLEILKEDPHLLSIGGISTKKLEIYDWEKVDGVSSLITDIIDNSQNLENEILFIETEGISRLDWDHDLLKILLNRTWFPQLKSAWLKVNLCKDEIEDLELFRKENPSNKYILEIKVVTRLSESDEYEEIMQLLARITNLKPKKLSVIFEDTNKFVANSQLESKEMDGIFKVISSAKNMMDLSIIVKNKNSKIADYSLELSSYSIPIMKQDLLDFRKNIAQGNLNPTKEDNLEMYLFHWRRDKMGPIFESD